MKAVIYARYSSQGQNEQTLEGQIRICKEYAESKGFHIVKTYMDKAYIKLDPLDYDCGYGADYFPETIISQIIADFGNDYKLFFKPHPSFIADNNKIKNKEITVLPAQLPMDVLLWAYPDVSIGGYNSSLYLSVRDAGQVKFFIERIGEEGHMDNILFVLDKNGFYQNVTKRYF